MEPSFLEALRTRPTWLIIFFSLGLLSLAKLSISLLFWSYAFLLRPAKNLKTHYGSWALITGPTDGIGKAHAFELARKGLNLILVGRNADKLTNVSTAIRSEIPDVKIKNVVIDLSGDLEDGARRLGEAIEGLDVGVLVNNAGVGPKPKFFHEWEIERWMEVVKVNLEALTKVTRVVLPGMLERRRGAIVNIGSGLTVVIPSSPLLAVYASTKE